MRLPIACLLAVLALLSGCKSEGRTGPKPVVHVPPVETHPFEEGYEAGFAAGKAAAKPREPVPSDERALDLAGVEAARDPQRNDKWRRGFAEGYTDGFRRVATGQK